MAGSRDDGTSAEDKAHHAGRKVGRDAGWVRNPNASEERMQSMSESGAFKVTSSVQKDSSGKKVGVITNPETGNSMTGAPAHTSLGARRNAKKMMRSTDANTLYDTLGKDSTN